jgi:2-pyrone-4,6-dicarboxylate lactonase
MTDAASPKPCPGAPAVQPAPTRLVMPANAVDTHCHVIGEPPAFPLVATRTYTPPPAAPEAYLAMLDAVGFARGVLIQVSVHGTDNSLMLQTLAANRDRLRGVAVMPHDLAEHDYARADAAGVRGLRLNGLAALYGGGIGLEHLDRYEALAVELGWHLQFLIDGSQMAELAPRLARLRCPWIVDHMGHVAYSQGVDDPGFQAVISAVRDGGWVKLSDAFRMSQQDDYRDSIPFAQALIEAAPDRCVWGSDWPHVAYWRPMPTVADLLDLLVEWAPDEAVRNRILADNPNRFYGF